ncbi:hypothetical protein HBH46_162710 [Parastagonospora nodorum]|nr:hypothetical protein HBH46_162710 [Parastagonospora nodorum]
MRLVAARNRTASFRSDFDRCRWKPSPADGSPVMEESESWDPKALHTTCIRHILNCRADAIKLRPANGSTASDSAPVTRACVTLEQRFL